MSKAKEASDKIRAAVAALNEALGEASSEGLIVELNTEGVVASAHYTTQIEVRARILQEAK